MVRQISENEGESSKIHYVCAQCGFAYDKSEWAQKCEDWCLKHKSCNLEIAKHSVSLARVANKS